LFEAAAHIPVVRAAVVVAEADLYMQRVGVHV